MDARAGAWLCRTEIERSRVIDNGVRVARARTIASASVAATLLLFAPMFGWWTLVLFGLSALNTQTVDRRMARSARPERHVAFSVFWSQLLLATAVALSGGPASPVLAWLVVPTSFSATRFRGQVVAAAVVSAVAMLLVATFAVAPAETVAHPASLVAAIALLVSITAVVAALSGAEVEQRSESVLDPLTGLLNRAALHRRFVELEEQAGLTGAALSMLVCDIDRFKSVNDTHGHDRGDAALRDVAYQMRKQLRSFELIYRVGGEEFVLVLPGVAAAEARAVAERLCSSIRECRPGGLAVTVSIGVTTASGDAVTFESLFRDADRALYAAKARGRDAVVSAEELDAAGADELPHERRAGRVPTGTTSV
ncbi:MAG: two-component system, cell cycle response regulator [Thermoleophilaceae bacterium]|nr:two-component system, cell cycle response regulator [Thermoleophilaceae bacterium]